LSENQTTNVFIFVENGLIVLGFALEKFGKNYEKTWEKFPTCQNSI